MNNDSLNNIWKTRDQIGAECGYDLKRLGTLIRREEIKVGNRLVLVPKTALRRKRRAITA